ncbi:MerR family transcriptional regulator [Kribbella sp. NPDC026611]|uniref:MerR family transcriptional regulator n=1 Tax=Kribbella sp. NPDC026611 TaxID=3154911 RepID=UPI003401E6E4
MDHSIGAVARRAGATVKTVRHYSDLGLLEYRRTSAGHRRYDEDAVARVRLIRTLRALGIDLPTVRAVLVQEQTLAEVLSTHADALAVQIRALQLTYEVLRRSTTLEELEHMHDLTAQSATERQALVAGFLSATLGDDPALAAVRQNLTPVLSDDADDQQVAAWLELAVLLQDPDFRESVRRMAVGYQALVGDDQPLWVDRGRLIELRRTVGGPRWKRYAELVAVVNGWDSRVAG